MFRCQLKFFRNLKFIRSTPHNHPAYNILEIEILSFATNIKERSLSEDIAPSAIYNDERRKLIERTQSESSELAQFIPSLD